ncbi:MAG: metallophosphatase [Erysipelotrichaceae bacterium]|nr:metallophosphatase [Erysipelotrichaceae bacterium]
MKKIINIISILLVCLIISGCGLSKKDINIIYTNDVHGNVNSSIGYSGIKGYANSLKKDSYVSLVDGGDFAQGTYLADNSEGLAIVEIMNEMGYDVATLGNHEFDYGLGQLSNIISKAKFDVVGCNVNYFGSGDDPFKEVKPYVVKSYGGTKIAYIGVLTPDTLNEENPSSEKCKEEGEFVVNFESINGGDSELQFFDNLQKIVDEANTKADYVVVLSHLGNGAGLNTQLLIKNTRGIDVVLDAHSHSTKNDIRYNADEKEVILLSAGKSLECFGQITINIDGNITAELLDSTLEKDSSLQNKIDELINKYE